MTPTGVTLRAPVEADWDEIARLADVALAHVAGAAPQHEWVANRRRFEGERHHRVAARDGRVEGYCAIERADGQPAGLYRLFLVTSWIGSPEIADLMYAAMSAELERRGAVGVWLRELADDDRLIAFVRERGFSAHERYALDGLDIVSLAKPLSPQSEARSS